MVVCTSKTREHPGQPSNGTAHKKSRRNERLKRDAKQKNKSVQLLLVGFTDFTNLSCFQNEIFLSAKGRGFFLFVFNKIRVFFNAYKSRHTF